MPTWKELKRFCENDGWELYKNTDHYFFRKKFPDGTVKQTKVSRGSGEIKGHLWDEIRNRQLQVSESYFNSKK